MKTIIDLIRVKHWIKNVIVFSAILFAKKIMQIDSIILVIKAFFSFCFISSSIYVLNDIIDYKKDRIHPIKKNRPIASGKISKKIAFLISVALLLLASALAYTTNINLLYVILSYYVMNILYSFKLKQIVIVDIMIISIGFIFRVLAGCYAINVVYSEWILMCTFFLSLFLGFGKRKNEIVVLKEKSDSHRHVLKDYNEKLLDNLISIVTAVTLVSYSIYTVSDSVMKNFNTKNLIFTIPFVVYGIFRYLFLIHVKGKGGNPTHIALSDVPLIINLFLWAVTVYLIIY